MDRELLQDYYHKSEFSRVQAEALAAIFTQFREEMATKQDLAVLRAEMHSELGSLKADLTWRFLGLLAFFSTVTTLVNLFAG
jgi:hypothetical protein